MRLEVREGTGDYRPLLLKSGEVSLRAGPVGLRATDEAGRTWSEDFELREGEQHAVEIGLDADKFNECLDAGKHEADWKKDLEEGARYGVSGTPAVFINGRMVSGARPYEEFTRVIDEELQRAGIPIPPAPATPTPPVGGIPYSIARR